MSILDSCAMPGKKSEYRSETDCCGSLRIPCNAYWGIKTARALEASSLSTDVSLSLLVDAVLQIERALALVSADMGLLEQRQANALSQSADEALSGQWREQFFLRLLDFEGGLPLLHNVQEVLSSRACEMLAIAAGEFSCFHSNNLVKEANKLALACRLACSLAYRELDPVLLDTERLLRRKSLEYSSGTLPQQFNSYASAIQRCHKRFNEASQCLLEHCLSSEEESAGESAVPPAKTVAASLTDKLNDLSGVRLKINDLSANSTFLNDMMELSSAVRCLSLELSGMAVHLGQLVERGELFLPSSHCNECTAGGAGPNHDEWPLRFLQSACLETLGTDAVVSACRQVEPTGNNFLLSVASRNVLTGMTLLLRGLSVFNKKCLSGLSVPKTPGHQIESPLPA